MGYCVILSNVIWGQLITQLKVIIAVPNKIGKPKLKLLVLFLFYISAAVICNNDELSFDKVLLKIYMKVKRIGIKEIL